MFDKQNNDNNNINFNKENEEYTKVINEKLFNTILLNRELYNIF